jgi:hypothetical protein
MMTASLRHHGRWLVAVVAALAAAVLTSAAAAREPTPRDTPGTAVIGAGTTTLGARFPAQYRGDQILVMVSARTLADHTTRGTFMITHRKANGDLLADLRGTITCLSVEGGHAVATGLISFARTPGLPGGELHEGMVAAIVVRDGGSAGDGMAWTFGDTDQVPQCRDLPDVAVVPVEHGSFVVHD